MNKIIKFCTIILLFLLSVNNGNTTFFKSSSSKKQLENIKEIKKNEIAEINYKNDSFKIIESYKDINLEEVFKSFVSYYGGNIPKSYQYINVNLKGISKDSDLYKNIQKLIYLDLLPNKGYKINGKSKLSALELYNLAEILFKVNLVQSSQIKKLKLRIANTNDLKYLKNILTKNKKANFSIYTPTEDNSKEIKNKQRIFEDVYKTIKSLHYNKKKITDVQLIEGATKGLAHGTGDKFTTFFPPVDNKDFMESLNGKFEGIGSYVEMEKAGVLMIVSPISGSPSEKAGLIGGDRVLKVNGKEIKKTTSLNEAISWIKGPKGTKVELTILRKGHQLKIDVIRDTIIIKNVKYEKLDQTTFYIKLVTFGTNISGEFKKSLEALREENGIKKVIFDLRNNPGGYLHEVSDMLGYFVPKGKETAVVKYLSGDQNYYSKGYELIDFSRYRIIILQNSGSASASEIFVGTLKDYFPKATIIGGQSYGKGSVQTMKKYSDGSSFKYTIAKWFTGKSQTGIDGVGIPVDVELKFDFKNFKKTKIDNQLEKAKNID